MPSALAPLSPLMKMMSVLSSLPMILDRLNDAADLVVGVHEIGRVHICLPDEELFLVGRQRVPFLQQVVGQAVSLASCGITPSFFWFAKIWSRIAFQPLSNRCRSLAFLIHSGVG